MTGEPLPSDNFGTNAPDNIISESPGLPQHRLSVGLAETDLSFLPSMDSRGRFEGKLSDLVDELIRQQRFLEASECGNYIEKLGEEKEDSQMTNAWRNVCPPESITKFSDLRKDICEICGENGLLSKRFSELFPYATESNKESLIELASSDLKKVLMLLKKATLLRDIIIGINAPMGRYENYPENWMLLLKCCKEQLNNAHAFVDKLVSGVEKINAKDTFTRQISVTEVLKEKKVSSYFKCIFAMYKVCCSLQLWIVYDEKSRKKLLGEMDVLKKKWKSLGQTLKNCAFDFPRIKMVTYKHVAEDDIVDGDKNACLCNLSLLPIRKDDQKIVYAGNIYRSDCINFWVNSITTSPP